MLGRKAHNTEVSLRTWKTVKGHRLSQRVRSVFQSLCCMIEPYRLEFHHYLYLFILLPLTEIKEEPWKNFRTTVIWNPAFSKGTILESNLGAFLFIFFLVKATSEREGKGKTAQSLNYKAADFQRAKIRIALHTKKPQNSVCFHLTWLLCPLN